MKLLRPPNTTFSTIFQARFSLFLGSNGNAYYFRCRLVPCWALLSITNIMLSAQWSSKMVNDNRCDWMYRETFLQPPHGTWGYRVGTVSGKIICFRGLKPGSRMNQLHTCTKGLIWKNNNKLYWWKNFNNVACKQKQKDIEHKTIMAL